MTVIEAIQKGSDFLARKGLESPRLQSELLLAHVLNLPRLRLYLEFERALNDPQTNAYRDLLTRRGTRVPLQHLTGSTSFCGYPILVSSAVLVPRPETELLAEAAWKFLNELKRPARFADIGTGSGCIAIAIAAEAKEARGVAIDISPDALAMAARNFEANKIAERVELRAGDFLAGFQPAERFDVIVSNPPYIPGAEIEALEPEVRDHDPRLALDGGADGLDFYRALAEGAGQLLEPGGRLFIEFGDGQSEALRQLFIDCGWNIHSVILDLAQKPRHLIATRG
jgi:release factor glutamine methyltransferase